MKTAIYVRVSTEEQAREGYSVSGQLQKLKAFCISQEWKVAGVYVDEGISAKNMDRPQLQQMINDIKDNKIDCVLVYRLDRLTRSVFDLYKLLETFDKHNCKFKSATEVYDTTTAMGRMFITIVAALAQWERENMGERISFGFEEKVRQGKCPFNFSPMGYTLNKEESKLYIHPIEANTVKIMFEKYIEGYGSNRLCRYLNENGLLTKRGNKWSSNTLFKVLKSPIPAGGIRWNNKNYWDLHEPIISKETWEKAQELMKIRKIKPAASVSSPYLFSGLIKCNSCNQGLTGNQTSYINANGDKITYYFYRCTNKKVGKCNTTVTSFMETQIEKAFIDILGKWEFKNNASNVAKIGLDVKDVKVDVDKLENELQKIEARKKKWQYAWIEELINEKDFKKRMDEEHSKEKQIREQLNNTVIENDPVSEEEIKDALLEIKENWNEMKKLEKKNLLYEIIEDIKVEKINNRIKITNITFI